MQSKMTSNVKRNSELSFEVQLRHVLILITGENSQLDDLYTRYRQRLRKSLFESGLTTAFAACIICLCVLFSFQVKIILFILIFSH